MSESVGDKGQSGIGKYLKYHDLAPNRIRDILLVSSEYDAFVVEEDGQLSARLFMKYSEFLLISAPRVVHARTETEALRILNERRVDLVLTTLRDGETGAAAFVSQLLWNYPTTPIVLLVLDEVELRRLRMESLPPQLFGVFLWTGDSRLVTAILNLVEDRLNVAEDIEKAGVQVIIAVEDSVSSYSLFLAHLYEELMVQSRSLLAEGVNFGHRVLRMLTRPKILLAKSYEEAWSLFSTYRSHVMALVTDVQFVREGVVDAQAGFKLAKKCQEQLPGLQVLLHSADLSNRAQANELGLHFAEKRSDTLRQALHSFLEESLGFGDFVFRMPDRSEVARARDTYELERVLRTVDSRSVFYHASNKHFHVWLKARSSFDLANEVLLIEEDKKLDVEQLREQLVSVLHRYAQQEQDGVISDFSRDMRGPQRHFVKVGGGSIGGKGRGIAFLNSRLARPDFIRSLPGLTVAVPRTVVLGTNVFDEFLRHNSLLHVQNLGLSDEELLKRFLAAELPKQIAADLRPAMQSLKGPLIVRSSSLLEDSQHQSCAGVYHTCLVPNVSMDPSVRFGELCKAIYKVYMSTFSSKARSYLENTMFSVEEEKMAVVIQEVVGSRHGNRLYPDFAGVALSYNYYPVGSQLPEEGVALMSLGLGHMVVEGGRAVRFSPKRPGILTHLYDPAGFLEAGQKRFYAVDLSRDSRCDGEGLTLCSLSEAEEDGTLDLVGSVYSPDDGCWRDSLSYSGPRAVTFNNILKWQALPLSEVLSELLERLGEAMDCPVELEFAVDMHSNSSDSSGSRSEVTVPTLYLLQIRPLTGLNLERAVQERTYSVDEVFCTSNSSLGQGAIYGIRDIVYVKTDSLSRQQAHEAAGIIGRINRELLKSNRPYMLIGPGRWGSADPSLGIPVETSAIVGAKVIVELPYADRNVEPSQGSHFFHELTSLNIGYLTILKGAGGLDCQSVSRGVSEQSGSECRCQLGYRCNAQSRRSCQVDCLARGPGLVDTTELPEAGYLDSNWLASLPAVFDSPLVRHCQLELPLEARLDGRYRRAVVLKGSQVEPN